MEITTFEELARFPLFQKFYRVAWKLFGVTIALVRPNGRESVLLGSSRRLNPFCRLIKSDPAGRSRCAVCDFMHQEEVKRLQAARRYACHAGLTDFTIPVFGDGKIIALMQCGQILDQKPTPGKWRKARARLRGLRVDFKKMERHFFATRVVPVRDQENLIELLEVFANYITDTDRRWLFLEKGRRPQIVRLADDYVRKHLSDELKLDDIARAAYTSPRNLTRVFAQETKMTILEYIHALRIDEACRRLLDPEKKISEIAFESGFGSIQQFNRVFKKLRNCPPEIFRAKKQKTEAGYLV